MNAASNFETNMANELAECVFSIKKNHSITNFSLPDKARLIRKLRETDPKFAPWFASHSEATEKKIKEVAADREMVEPGSVQGMQG